MITRYHDYITKNLKAKVWLLTFASFVLIGVALFLSAGTIDYWQAWVYLGVTAATSGPLADLFTRDPILLESRTKLGPAAETRTVQKIVLWCAAIPGIAAYVVPGLDHRFGWSNVPVWLSIVANLLILISMVMVYKVFKENSYGSATIEVAKNQKVISTGLYAIVRNPMYSCAVLYFIGLSLGLGSYWGLIPGTLMTGCLVWRLFDEERFLAQNLPGYLEYCAKVHWHLIPGIF